MRLFDKRLFFAVISLLALAGTLLATEGSRTTELLEITPPNHQFNEKPQSERDEAQVKEALQRYEKILQADPDNHEFLLKAAYLYYRLGWLYAGKEEKKAYYFKLYDYATRASKIAPHEYRSSLLLAVAKAKIVGYLSHRDQVRIARELAQQTQELVQLKGDDPDPLYLLSWLNFEIGRISTFNKIMAATLFGGLPEGLSVDNAFTLMDKAIHFRRDYAVYQYDLGFYYLRTGVKDKARRQFEQVLTMRPQSAEEIVYQQRAAAKIRELNNGVN